MVIMRPFSFVHAADLHLDSPFNGVTAEAPEIAGRLQEATFEAYESLIGLCLEESVDFLLIAGDVYDSADRSVRAQLTFRDGLERLARAGIPSFLVHGNHDPLEGWAASVEWPEGVTVFGSDQVSTGIVEVSGEAVAAVSGISYQNRQEKENLARKFRAENPHLFQIALLHGNCESNPRHEDYAPSKLEDLTSSGFDYWALGHVHERKILSRDPLVAYPGNTQGRSIREAGERGCYLVRIDSAGNASPEFRPLDAVRWFSAEIGIESLNSLDALDRQLEEVIENLRAEAEGRRSLCRLTLTGRGSLYPDLRRENSIADLLDRTREIGREEPFVWVQEIAERCRPEVDVERRREADDFLGEVLRQVAEMEDILDTSEDGRMPPELLEPLQTLLSHRRASRFLDPPEDEEARDLLREAERICLDLLEGPR